MKKNEQNSKKQYDQLWDRDRTFVIVQILSGTGHLSRLLTGLLVPLCVYIDCSNIIESGSWLFRRAEPWSCWLYVRRCIFQCAVFTRCQ